MYDYGFVNEVVADEEFDERVIELTADLVRGPPRAHEVEKTRCSRERTISKPDYARSRTRLVGSGRPKTSSRESMRSMIGETRSFRAMTLLSPTDVLPVYAAGLTRGETLPICDSQVDRTWIATG
ncbi:hypothetical protein [Haloglomus irregulare]